MAAAGPVGSLGEASASCRIEASRLDARGRETARMLVEDIEFLASVPGYAKAHATCCSVLASALDGIWPRSSPQRPSSPSDAAARCGAIVSALDDARSELAAALTRLPQGPDADRIMADGRQILLLEDRLATVGVDAKDPAGTELGRAAARLVELYGRHGLLTLASAQDAAREARRRSDDLVPIDATIQVLVGLSGLPAATASQVGLLAKAVAEIPIAWCAALHPDSDAQSLLAALESDVATEADEAASAEWLDRHYGTAWRDEEPGKLEAAARILGIPDDPRSVKALAYAGSLGCPPMTEAETSPVLSAMAYAKLALRRLPETQSRDAAATALGVPGETDSGSLLDMLRAVDRWRTACGRTETLRRFHVALALLDPAPRDKTFAEASAVMAILSSLPDETRRLAASGLAASASTEADSLGEDVSGLEEFGTELCDAARRPAGYLRDRSAALARIEGEPLYASLGFHAPDAIPGAIRWMDESRAALPEGIEPGSRHAAVLLDHARRTIDASAEILAVEAKARDRVLEADPGRLVAAARGALTEIRLRESRQAVDAAGGWGLVAWLEEEGIEPELWTSVLASAQANSVTVAAIPVPVETAAVETQARPQPISADGSLTWRKVRVSTQGRIRALECGST